MRSIEFMFEGRKISAQLNRDPDKCPICQASIQPIFHKFNHTQWRVRYIQAVYECPSINCRKLFISNYQATDSLLKRFIFSDSVPITKVKKQFNESIKSISQNFCTIYNEAFWAEQESLLQICGVGYRKALEFLIKDYLVSIMPEKEEVVKKGSLGKCIAEYIENNNVKEVAKRATWLGNDETHYVRTWIGKDVQDLKTLIDIVVFWIEMEQKTKEAIKSMPDKTGT